MIYTIEWMERKTTSTGKNKIDARLRGEDKTLAENVTIWQDFPDFDKLMNGGQVEGDLVPAKDPKWGPTLYPPKAPKTASTGGYKQKLMEETMAKKNAAISQFQANKEEAMKMAGAQRDAVLVVVNLYQEIAEDKVLTASEKETAIKKEILKWRDWFLSAEFNNTLPF